MKTLGKLTSGIFAAILVLSAAQIALADPPSRVARLQYISGAISVQPSGVKDWVEGAINRPLTTSDRVWADKDSRAELHLGNAVMRVDSETSLTLTNIADNTVQVELDQGTLNLRIRHLYDGEIYEVDTPNMAFTLTKAGDYRFDVDPTGDISRVTVRKGEGEATGDGRAVKVRKGETASFSVGTSLETQIGEARELDGFDDWCHVRNQRQDHSESARYVSPDVIGAEDLDQYGTWHTVPTYGAVWVPAVAPGWAPYHYGHWVWVEPWGWTWIDDAPWGFAPCHYGRWVYYNNYWGWVPGPVAVRPVYAPALVAWVGGNHWGVGLSFGAGGGVGWFPLGYGEPYVPAYHVSRNYFQNVNVTNTHITNITNVTNNYYNTNVTNNNTNVTKVVYKNQTVPGAMTAVSKTVMTSSQPVAKASVQVPVNQVRTASVAAAPEVAPGKASVLGVRGSASLVPPAQAAPRQVVSKLPPPAKPVPFYVKQEALAAHPGRPLDSATEEQIRARVSGQPVNAHAVGSTATATEPTPGKATTSVATKPVPAEPGSGKVPVNAPIAASGSASAGATSSGASAPKITPSGPQKQVVTSESPAGRAVPARPVAPMVARPTPTPVAARPVAAEPISAQPTKEASANDAPGSTPVRAVPQPSAPQLPKQNPVATEPGRSFPVRVVPRPPVNSRVVNTSSPVFPNRAEPTSAVAHPGAPGGVGNSPVTASPEPVAERPASMTSAPNSAASPEPSRNMNRPVPRPPASGAEVPRRTAAEPASEAPARGAQQSSQPDAQSHNQHGIFSRAPEPSQPAVRQTAPSAPAQRSTQSSPRASTPEPRVSSPAPRTNIQQREAPVQQRSAPAPQNMQRQSAPAPRPVQVKAESHHAAQEQGAKQREERSRP